MDYFTYSNHLTDEDYQNDNQQALQRKRSLRSNKSEVVTNGNSHHDDAFKTKACSSTESGTSDSSGSLTRTQSLRLLPDHVYAQQPPPPCLVYGAIHLTRLFVKLPELMGASCIEENKWKTISQHLDLFIDYLNDHREWFGENFYIDK